MNLNLEPLKTLLSQDIPPNALSKLLDELLYDYMATLVKIQLSDCKDKTIHGKTDEFIFYIKLLRDILPYCEKRMNVN